MRISARDQLPFSVQEALVQACGDVFWYKRPLIELLRRAGVPAQLVAAYSDLSKYKLVREVLRELDSRGSPGLRVQQQIVRDLVTLRTFGHDVDVAAAQRAIDALRASAEEHGVLSPTHARPTEVESVLAGERRQAQRDARRQTTERLGRLRDLHREFCALVTDDANPQRRGYRLEEIVGRLIRLEGLPYTPPFRRGTVTQTDGFFSFRSFQYLLETKWTAHMATVAELGAFSDKVHRSSQSTRGLFVSIAGYREEVAEELARGHRNVFLMSGAELAIILEGTHTFSDVLQRKLDEGARTGSMFFDVSRAR